MYVKWKFLTAANYATIGMGAINVAMTIVSVYLVSLKSKIPH